MYHNIARILTATRDVSTFSHGSRGRGVAGQFGVVGCGQSSPDPTLCRICKSRLSTTSSIPTANFLALALAPLPDVICLAPIMPMTWLRWRLLRPRCCNHLPPISSAPSQCLSRLPFLSQTQRETPFHAIRAADLARHQYNRPRLTPSTAPTSATTALSISNTVACSSHDSTQKAAYSRVLRWPRPGRSSRRRSE